jgi:hypothetical protein
LFPKIRASTQHWQLSGTSFSRVSYAFGSVALPPLTADEDGPAWLRGGCVDLLRSAVFCNSDLQNHSEI